MSGKTLSNSDPFTIGVCVLFAALTIGGIMSQTISGAPGEGKKQSLLRHVVLYKFKAETTAQQIQEVVEAFSALPSKIDTIAGFERGTNISEENKSEGFTHCFVVTFKDVAGRATYLKHPAHDDYVKVVKDRRDKVIVFDYWTER